MGNRAGTSLVGPDGTISDRARAAGGIARVIGRNPALFAPLKPRPARVAIVYDPRSPMDASSPMAVSLSTVYRALFERNIQVDFIHLDEIAAGMVSRYAVVVVGSPSTLPQPGRGCPEGPRCCRRRRDIRLDASADRPADR